MVLFDQLHHDFAFAGHESQQGFGLEGEIAGFINVFDGAAVVETDQIAVVFFGGQVDLFLREGFDEGLEMEGFAVDDDPVKIEENRGRPGHGRRTYRG